MSKPYRNNMQKHGSFWSGTAFKTLSFWYLAVCFWSNWRVLNPLAKVVDCMLAAMQSILDEAKAGE